MLLNEKVKLKLI